MTEAKPVKSWLTDMDGVLVHEGQIIPGADKFIRRLRETNTGFLVLTNNPMYTPRDLQVRLQHTGIDVPAEAIWTSALATAKFLDKQRPGGTAYVIGEAGLTTALHDIGYVLTDVNPDYVVLGDTREFSFRAITTAIRLIRDGARFVATNPDPTGPSPEGVTPSTGSMAALISKATGVQPYFIGKPNPLMMREALNTLGAHSETTVMVGDRMDTDIITGLEAGMRTILVLTGITSTDDIDRYPFRPTRVVPSIADLVDDV
jgi:5'-nucleotidase